MARSSFVFDRIAGLFYANDDVTQEHVAVILIDHASVPSFREPDDRPALGATGLAAGQRAVVGEWPPDYDIQAQIIEGVLERCPAGLFIDIFYIFRRGVTNIRAMTADEAAAWRQASGQPEGARVPSLVEDDDFRFFLKRITDARAAQGRPVAEGGCPNGATEVFAADFADGQMNAMQVQPDLLAANAPLRLLPSTWPRQIEDKSSNYHGVDLTADYPLTPVTPYEYRPSAALTMYAAYCATPDPVGCPDILIGRPLRRASGASEEIEPEWAKGFAAPIDIRWRTTYPPQNETWWKAETDCVPAGKNASLPERVSLALTQARSVAIGSEVGAEDTTVQTCFPLVTVPAYHLMETFAVGPDDAEAARQRAADFAIRNKYVFIGLHLPNLGDLVDTSTHGLLPGVFRHAMATDNLIRMGIAYERPPWRLTFAVFGADLTLPVTEFVEAAVIVGFAALLALGGHVTAGAAHRRTERWAMARFGPCVARSIAEAAAYCTQVMLYVALAGVAMAGLIAFSLAMSWPGLNWLEVIVFMPLAYTFQSILGSNPGR